MSFPNLDPSAPAVLFPGQGSQTPEMRDVVRRRCPELYERCLDLVGEDPFLRVEESTRFQQPAIFCASWAGWTALRDEPTRRRRALARRAGRAGRRRRADARRRARARRPARHADGRGRPARLDGRARRRLARGRRGDRRTPPGVVVANDNAPGQIVLAGDRENLESVEDLAGERGLRAIALPRRRRVPLAVDGAGRRRRSARRSTRSRSPSPASP